MRRCAETHLDRSPYHDKLDRHERSQGQLVWLASRGRFQAVLVFRDASRRDVQVLEHCLQEPVDSGATVSCNTTSRSPARPNSATSRSSPTRATACADQDIGSDFHKIEACLLLRHYILWCLGSV